MLGGSNQLDKGLGKKIVELYGNGFSYRDIQIKLGCSKGLISYHCGAGQKEKTRANQRRNRGSDVLKAKVQRFVGRPRKQQKAKKESINKRIEDILRIKIRGFCLTEKVNGRYARCKTTFKVKDLVKKIRSNPVCYLTGRPINLEEGRSYHLDHIIPRSKGGDNSLDNCGLTCRVANQAKNDMTLEEFVQLCKEVLERHEPSR